MEGARQVQSRGGGPPATGRDGHDGRVPPRARPEKGAGSARTRHAPAVSARRGGPPPRRSSCWQALREELAAEHQDVRAAVAAPLGRCPGAVVQDLQAGRRRARGRGTERGISVRPEADALTRLARRRHISTKPQHGRREPAGPVRLTDSRASPARRPAARRRPLGRRVHISVVGAHRPSPSGGRTSSQIARVSKKSRAPCWRWPTSRPPSRSSGQVSAVARPAAEPFQSPRRTALSARRTTQATPAFQASTTAAQASASPASSAAKGMIFGADAASGAAMFWKAAPRWLGQ